MPQGGGKKRDKDMWRGGQHVERTTCGEDDMWRGRHVERTTCGEDDMWRGGHVERTTCGEDDMWRGRHVERTTCGAPPWGTTGNIIPLLSIKSIWTAPQTDARQINNNNNDQPSNNLRAKNSISQLPGDGRRHRPTLRHHDRSRGGRSAAHEDPYHEEEAGAHEDPYDEEEAGAHEDPYDEEEAGGSRCEGGAPAGAPMASYTPPASSVLLQALDVQQPSSSCTTIYFFK
ncbi:hypothetical protein EYF80_037603 [Liparis tanakae]|uniref:Uncharacterized protein n=1 Tax=Liparis tanakae TaxID=230148 RepID=A0A4Z2GH19_9TELE|nr:hypothetical protein EYF80_037603 [Liparis tanakae]